MVDDNSNNNKGAQEGAPSQNEAPDQGGASNNGSGVTDQSQSSQGEAGGPSQGLPTGNSAPPGSSVTHGHSSHAVIHHVDDAAFLIVRDVLADYVPTNPVQSRLKEIVSEHFQGHLLNADNISSTMLLQNLGTLLRPEMLYSREALTGQNVIHKVVRDYLLANGFRYKQYPKNNRIAWGLMRQLYTEDADRLAAVGLLEADQQAEKEERAHARRAATQREQEEEESNEPSEAGDMIENSQARISPPSRQRPTRAARGDIPQTQPQVVWPPVLDAPHVPGAREWGSMAGMRSSVGYPSEAMDASRHYPQDTGRYSHPLQEPTPALAGPSASPSGYGGQASYSAPPPGMAAPAPRFRRNLMEEQEMEAMAKASYASRISSTISSSFRKEGEAFTGNMGESLTDTLENYEAICDNLGLTDTSRKNFLYLALDGQARRFYRRQILTKAENYGHAVQLLKTEYVNESRQNECHLEASQLRLANTKRTMGYETARAIDHIKDRIVLLNPNGPEAYRGDRHMRNYLSDAFIGEPWAQGALSRAVSENWSMHKLYQALSAAWSQYKKYRLTNSSQLPGRRIISAGGPLRTTDTHFTGQSTLRHPRAPGSKSSAPGTSEGKHQGAQSRQGQRRRPFVGKCFGCNQDGHMLRNCPNGRKSLMRNIHYALQDFTPADVLYEVVYQAGESGIAMQNSTSEDDAMFVLQEIVQYYAEGPPDTAQEVDLQPEGGKGSSPPSNIGLVSTPTLNAEGDGAGDDVRSDADGDLIMECGNLLAGAELEPTDF